MVRQNIKQYFAILIILGLLGSFGLHALQVEHTHGGSEHAHAEGGSSIPVLSLLGEHMHQGDKKYLLVFVALSLSVFFLFQIVALQEGLRRFACRDFRRSRNNRLRSVRFFDTTHLLLGEGILHTKVY